MTAERIDPQQVVRDQESGNAALLVCAYDDDEKFEENQLDNALSLSELQEQEKSIPKDCEIIFYCGSPNEATSARRAAEYRAKGFTNTKVLRGGVAAWRDGGFRVPGM